MAFDLTLATLRSHDGARSPGERDDAWAIVITLRGALDAGALRRVDEVLDAQRALAAASILVDLADVAAEPQCLAALSESVMRLRGEGVQIQIGAHDPALAEALRALPDARDWLVAGGVDAEAGARRAIHLDGPRLEES